MHVWLSDEVAVLYCGLGIRLDFEGKRKRTEEEEKKDFSPFQLGSLGGNYFSHFLIRKKQERGFAFFGAPAFWGGPVLGEVPFWGRSCFGILIWGGSCSLGPCFWELLFGRVISGSWYRSIRDTYRFLGAHIFYWYQFTSPPLVLASRLSQCNFVVNWLGKARTDHFSS